ncbi:Hypothetical protein CINCED_3A023286 [Cinara cedri]|uniref:Uncharacterized protein n=1 Tax=Cinara cedri TaxID=506608 RepID=A0A5E4NRN5_9HEMI|nr:Hypothetical protein CINCED_3A023286 [Cinara cedri]
MVDAVYRGNIEELLSVINHLKKYIIVFVIVLLVLVSIFHFSKYSVHVVPLITVTLVLLPAVYYTTVLIFKFCAGVISSSQTGEVTTMNVNGNQQDVLKTPEVPYPLSLTPPPSYEEATRNDHCYQPQPWLPSTSTGYTSAGAAATIPSPPAPVFNMQYQCNAIAAATATATVPIADPPSVTAHDLAANNSNGRDVGTAPPPPTNKNIPSVTITLDTDRADQRSMEI